MGGGAALERGGRSGTSDREAVPAVVSELVHQNQRLAHDLRGELAVIKLALHAAGSGSISAVEAFQEVAMAAAEAELMLGRSLVAMKELVGEQ